MAINDVWRAISLSTTVVIFCVIIGTHRDRTGKRDGRESEEPY